MTRTLSIREAIRFRNQTGHRVLDAFGNEVDIDTLELAARYSGVRRVLHSSRFVNKSASDHTSGFRDLFGEINNLAESSPYESAGIRVEIEPLNYTISDTLSYDANNCWINAHGAIFTQVQDGITSFVIGDSVGFSAMRFGGIKGLHVRGHQSIADSTSSRGIAFYAPFFHHIENLHVGNFYKGIDAYRLHHAFMTHWFFDQQHRTTGQGAYALGFHGDPLTGQQSGSNKCLGLWIHGSGTEGLEFPWETGILIRSMDTIFTSLGHIIGCSTGLLVSPNATNAGNAINDVAFDNFYFDVAETRNVRIEGRVRALGKTGTDGEVLIGTGGNYIGVGFNFCEFRRATYGIEVSIEEITNDRPFRDLYIGGGCRFRNHSDTNIILRGKSSGKVNVENLIIGHDLFAFGNFDGTATTSHIQVEAENGVIIGNVHRDDRNAATRVADIKFYEPGKSIIIAHNDVSTANPTDTIDPYRIERIPGVNAHISGMLYPRSGRFREQVAGVQTSETTPTATLITRVLTENDRFDLTGEVMAHDEDNSIYCKWYLDGVVTRSMPTLADVWLSSTSYALSNIVRPTVQNGFRYLATSTTSDTLSGTVEPIWPTTVGATIVDNNVTWTCMDGVPLAWAAATAYAAGNIRRPTAANSLRYEVASITGAGMSGGIEPTWPTVIGDVVIDNEVTWICIGRYGNADWLRGTTGTVTDDSRNTSALTAWAAATAYVVGHLRRPTVVNGLRYEVTAIAGGGLSGGAEPSWPTTVGNTVVDNQVTWTCRGPTVAISLTGNTISVTVTGLPTTTLEWSYVPGRMWS